MVNLRSLGSILTSGSTTASGTEPDALRIPGNFPSPTPRSSSSDVQPTELTGRPRINKAGLIVTAELDQAISRCRSKVQKLAQACRRGNRRYRDIDFDFLEDRENCLHGIVDPSFHRYTPTEALRVTQIFRDPKFFVDGATASDIAQGDSFGDCWFLSALAVVATAGLIEQICVERDEKVGIYGFIFWRDSGWVDVIIDDLLFVRVPRWTDLTDRERMLYKSDQDIYAKEARKGSKVLYFGKSLAENETWVPLIEKAYAKLHGDYSSLEGGFTNEAVEDLTGAVSTLMYMQDILDPDEFWTNELLNVQEDRAFACYTPDQLVTNMGLPNPEITNGLVKGHAYSVIKAVEFNGKKFLKVRNPWGKYEWTGRWSDGSKEWNGEWLEALAVLDFKFGNDGEFIMEYSDFLQAWDVVEKCRLFNKEWSCSQLWLSANLGTYPRPTNFGDVSFTFSLSKDTDAVIVLAQLDTRYFRGLSSQYLFSLYCQIFKKDEEDPVAISPHNSLWDRSVNLEVFLEAGDYVVHVRVERLPPVTIPDDSRPEDIFPPPPPETPTSRRKMLQKQSEKLRSMSIAANFRPADYGQAMPIAPETFAGMDLTRMELLMHSLFEEHRKQREAVYGPSKADQVAPVPPTTPTIDQAVQSGSPINETTQTIPVSPSVATLAPPSARSETFSAGETEARPAPAAEPAESKKDKSVEKDEPAKEKAIESEAKVKGDAGKEKDGEKEHKDGAVNEEVMESHPPPGATKKVHEGYSCDGCLGSIAGSRFRCLDVLCSGASSGASYDLCEDCMKKQGHRTGHQMIEITDPADQDIFVEEGNIPDESVIVGLRLYTHKDCAAVIQGQLRHGNVMRNYLTMSKII